jgi:hypothetical protein
MVRKLSTGFGHSIGTENPIPEKMDYSKVSTCVPVMNEVQFLFPPKPCEPQKPRPFDVVLLIEKDVRVKRDRARSYQNHEEIGRQQEISAPSDYKHRNEKERRVVAFPSEIRA